MSIKDKYESLYPTIPIECGCDKELKEIIEKRIKEVGNTKQVLHEFRLPLHATYGISGGCFKMIVDLIENSKKDKFMKDLQESINFKITEGFKIKDIKYSNYCVDNSREVYSALIIYGE